ncbi:MAG: hypothetical protein F6K39_26655 [Okeania sp. SIO3B3]|nr:hypothetical protein [Okeania sp. SIO3B3]
MSKSKLCEADYYICCLIAFIYYKKKYDLRLIEKYLYHAFCARENTVIYDNNLGTKDFVVSTYLTMVNISTDLVKSTSRKSFFQYCQAIIGKVNCLETEESDKIYQIKDNSWHSLLAQEDRRAALGTSSIRIRCKKITIKLDQCNTFRKGSSSILLYYYYRLYVPIIIEERYVSMIDAKSWSELFWGISKKNYQKNGDLKYFLRRGNKSILDLINQNNSVKNKLALCRNKLDFLEIEKDGLYFWTKRDRLSSISDRLPDDLFYAFEELAELLSTLSVNPRLRGR